MTSKRSTRSSTTKRAAAKKSHEQPAPIEIKRPKAEPTMTVTPAIGPNAEGEGHLVRTAHAIDHDALATRSAQRSTPPVAEE